MTGFTYLAIPYSHPDPAVRAARMRAFWWKAACLINEGVKVVSPMSLEPAVQARPDLAYDWNAWGAYSHALLGVCTRLVVLKLPGWSESEGVRGEMTEARRLGLAVEFHAPDPASYLALLALVAERDEAAAAGDVPLESLSNLDAAQTRPVESGLPRIGETP